MLKWHEIVHKERLVVGMPNSLQKSEFTHKWKLLILYFFIKKSGNWKCEKKHPCKKNLGIQKNDVYNHMMRAIESR
jgi:hypothetical protein